jgi:uncharacterized protein
MLLPAWALLLAIGVEDVPNPRQQNSWVSDTAGIISPEREAQLNALLGQINRQTNAEVAVVTVDDVDGTPKQFATKLFNHWGIGSAERNDGVLFLMVMNERRLEVEVGYGLEDELPDGWLGSMQTSSMVPRFKQSDFAGGLEVGVIEVGKRLGTSGLPSVSNVPADVEYAEYTEYAGSPLHEETGPDEPWLLYGLFFGGGLGLLGGGIRGARVLHHKRCKQCKLWRTVLPEDDDDAHLDAGQQREEELRSIDYDVYVCGQCSSVSVMGKRAWFSGYSRCSSCSYRTLTTNSRTIRSATTYSEGEAEVTEDCHHCNYHNVSYRTIPRIQESTSSSGGSSYGGGGGGSSFGGGSSGGGGAGSSW